MTDLSTPFATRLCLSGVESRRLLDTFKNFGVRHIQVSYYYLRKVFSDPTEFEDYTSSFSTVIIDSGTVYGNIKNEDQRRELLEEYASFLGALGKRSYTAAVYEDGVGLDKIVADEALIYPLDDIRSIFDNDLAAICNNIKYIGVSNKEAMGDGGENLIPIFAQASRHDTYVHAFGTGSKKILSKYPLYSANSSSWRSGSRYLNTYIYEGPGRGLRLYQPTDKKDPVKTEKEVKSIRRRQSNLVKVRSGRIHSQIDWDACLDGDSWAVDQANLAQWMLYAQDLELLPHNKYFLTEEERTTILLRKQELLGANLPPDSRSGNGDSNQSNVPGSVPDGEGGRVGRRDGKAEEEEVIDAEVVETSKEVLSPTAIASLDLDKPVSAERQKPVDDRMRTVRNCDHCILAGRCPKYQPSAACSYGLDPETPTYDHTKLDAHIQEDIADFLAIQKDRIMQAYLEEKMDASGLSKDLGKELERYTQMIALYREAIDNRDVVEMKVKGVGALNMFTRNNNKD